MCKVSSERVSTSQVGGKLKVSADSAFATSEKRIGDTFLVQRYVFYSKSKNHVLERGMG